MRPEVQKRYSRMPRNQKMVQKTAIFWNGPLIATGIRSWTKYMTAGHEVTGQDAWRQDLRSRARITDNGNKISDEIHGGRT